MVILKYIFMIHRFFRVLQQWIQKIKHLTGQRKKKNWWFVNRFSSACYNKEAAQLLPSSLLISGNCPFGVSVHDLLVTMWFYSSLSSFLLFPKNVSISELPLANNELMTRVHSRVYFHLTVCVTRTGSESPLL